tara:strand:- start:12 stop:449 length:438 start_codon:yes stop_codon:yes gene_type:complete
MNSGGQTIYGEPIDLDFPNIGLENDKKMICQTIMLYFDSIYESNPIKLKKVFHPNATIAGYMSAMLVENNLVDYGEFIALQRPSAYEGKEPKFLEILSLKVAGDTALALVRNGIWGKTFLDTLTFIRVDKDWLIYNKLFQIETYD